MNQKWKVFFTCQHEGESEAYYNDQCIEETLVNATRSILSYQPQKGYVLVLVEVELIDTLF